MKFNRLRLLGFKSFVEPAEFVIERGLTGVVGPNGCGKSNLVEALRWVMGESSYKNMRASGMDDVIFSGSATRPSRNTAEVTLFLDNGDRTAPAAFNDADELQVSRRIEREAGSIYRINGKEARAKDVQLLFADQSTGARSPSMVGQGRIGELIQAKPQARRALLEEAAGISGLHTRRHEAELRLRAAEQNLERLDDVVGELESQIESLKRQARQASRFKNLSADIRKAEATLLHLRWTLAKAHEAEAQSALAVATGLVAERASAQMNAAKEQAIGAHRLPELRDAEAAAAAAFQRLSIARAQLEEEAGRMRARQAELDKRIAQLDADIAREQQMLRDNADILQRLADEEATLVGRECGRRRRRGPPAGRGRRGDGHAHRQRSRARQADRRARRGGRRPQPVRALAARRRRAPRPAGAADRRCRARGRRDRAPHRRARRSGGKAGAGRGRRGRGGRGRAGSAGRRKGRRRRCGRTRPTLRAPLQEAKAELARIETEARTLAKILNAATGDLFPAVLEQIKVERGYETALGAALGEDLDVPLDRSAPAHWGGSEPQPGDPALPQEALPLASVVAGAAAARPPAGADRHRRSRPMPSGCPKCWRPASAWSAATVRCGAGTGWWQAPMRRPPPRSAWRRRTASPSSMPKPLAATKRLRAAEQALADAERALREGDGSRARGPAGLARRAASARRRARRAAEGGKGGRRTHGPPCALAESLSRLDEAHAEASGAVTEAERGLDAAPDLSELQAAFDRLAADVQRDRAALADARARHDGLKREAEQRARRLAAIAAERTSWISRGENADRQIAALDERRSRCAGRACGARRRARRDRGAPARADVAAVGGRDPAQGGGRPAAAGREPAVRARQGGGRRDPVAVGSAREPRPRRRAADRRRRAAARGRGAHAGGAEHAAASGDPPHRAGARRARCPMSPISSAGSNG